MKSVNKPMMNYDIPMQGGKLFITETVLRDAHQSHAATRMKLSDMLPACEMLDSIGYWSIECWGGATFDSCLRYLEEDPWLRLRELRKAMPHTKLQMLLRGQNLLGYRHYADDVVDAFVGKSIENGIDIIRIFDALNDIRNMEVSMRAAKKYGGFVEAALSYTKSPVHHEEYFVRQAKNLEQMGADSICIKDMSNILLPAEAFSLVRKLKENITVPIHLHTHNTAGTGTMVYLAAAMAGADIIDCALSPFAGGTSQPSTESIVAALAGTNRETCLDLQMISRAASCFKPVADKLEQEGFIKTKVLRVDPGTIIFQIPGGMLSNLIEQLKNANAEDKIEEVLKEVPLVRKDFGYPPLVTPTSQIVGTQAVLNVLFGRYTRFTNEAKGLLRGEYGLLPGAVNEEVRKMAIGNEEVLLCRPADKLEPELGKIQEENKDIVKTGEDLLSCAMFPQIAPEFIKRRDDLIVHEIDVEWIH